MQSSISASIRSQSLLTQYLNFLKAPDDVPLTVGKKTALTIIWRLYTVHLLLLIPMALGIQALSQWVVGIGENKIGTVFETMPPYQFFLLAVVFAPLSEEIMFRMPLRFSRFNWGVPLLILTFGLSAIAANLTPNFFLGSISWLLMLGLGIFFATLFIEQMSQRGGQFVSRHFRWLMYGSTLLFGLVHITNYPRQAWLVAPLLVLPQTTLGFLLAYVRVRLGFLWAIFTHALHNFVVSSPILIMTLGSEKLRQQFLSQNLDGSLLSQDIWLASLFLGWILFLLIVVFKTAIDVVREWKSEALTKA